MNKIAFALLMLLAFNVYSQDAYLCVTDKSTGFSKNKSTGEWVETSFLATDKFVITRSSETGRVWEVTETGSATPYLYCDHEIDSDGDLRCDGLGVFRFNNKNMRFLRTYDMGYVMSLVNPKTHKDIQDDNPLVEIGRCSKL
jgi:hypothetical protein